MVKNNVDIKKLEPNNTEIIKRIKAKRKEKNISQSEMAEKLGIPRTSYAYHESGKFEIGLAYLGKIANILDASIFDFIKSKDNNEDVVPDMPVIDKAETILRQRTPTLIDPIETYVCVLSSNENRLIDQLRMLSSDFKSKIYLQVDKEYKNKRIKRK